MPDYTYLLADLRTNALIDDVPLEGVRFSKRLNDAGDADATLSIDNLAPGQDPYILTTPGRTVLYILRDGRPVWGGIIWTRQYDSSAREVRLGLGDFWTYFDHRRVMPELTAPPGDVNFVAKQVVSFMGTEQNEIARELVRNAQSHIAGDIQIEFDTSYSGIFRDRTYYGYYLHSTGDMLRNLANVEDGPDMMFDVLPGDPAPRRILRIGDPWLGQQGSAFVWEYGGNLLSYTWPSDASRMATRAYVVGDGIEEGQMIAFKEDFSLYNDGWPLLENEWSHTSVTEAETLNAHAVAYQRGSRVPVSLPVLTVDGSEYPTVGEYAPGDDCRVIINDEFFRAGLDTAMRIVGMEVSVADDGDETVRLTMSPLLEGSL